MTFEELEARMRPHEAASGPAVPAGAWLVARLDGRGFTRLLARRPELEGPLDARVRDVMIATADHLMNCGPRFAYAHTHSDEISLLFAPGEGGRPANEYVALLAGEASAKCTLLLGEKASFDCRLVAPSQREQVVEYFRWRQADGERQAVAAHCRWLLREHTEAGADPLAGAGVEDQRALLRQAGVDWARVPDWQRRGVGLYWSAIKPLPGAPEQTVHRRIRVELELAADDDYAALVRSLVEP